MKKCKKYVDNRRCCKEGLTASQTKTKCVFIKMVKINSVGKMMLISVPVRIKLSLSNSLVDNVSSLLLQDNNLESFEVRQSSTSFPLSNLLSPRRSGPLFGDTGRSPLLRNSSRLGTSWQSKGQWSQNDLTQVNSLTWDTGGWTVNQSL